MTPWKIQEKWQKVPNDLLLVHVSFHTNAIFHNLISRKGEEKIHGIELSRLPCFFEREKQIKAANPDFEVLPFILVVKRSSASKDFGAPDDPESGYSPRSSMVKVWAKSDNDPLKLSRKVLESLRFNLDKLFLLGLGAPDESNSEAALTSSKDPEGAVSTSSTLSKDIFGC